MFGDGLGGVLLFNYLIVYGVATYAPNILAAISKQKLNDLQTLYPQVKNRFYIFS